jgi:tetratricopeptide (TPR) repeat protein
VIPESPELMAMRRALAQALRAMNSSFPEAGELAVPAGQEVAAGLVAAVGAELAGGLAGPLLYLAFLSTPQAQAVPGEWREQLHQQLAMFLHGWAATMERRELLRLLGWVATTVAASPVVGNLDPDEQERLVRALVSPSRVDTGVIDHIETMLRHCKRQEDVLGPHAVLQTVLAQRELVRSLLAECPAELHSRLLSVYSSMSNSIGRYFFELDDTASAMRYCEQARVAAQEARNTESAVFALCEMSCFASRQGKAHAGIDFAAAAQSLAGKVDDVLLQVCVAERAASAYAVDGQYQESMAEFDRAMAGLALPAGRRSPESPAYWFDEGLIASRQSESLLQLGRSAEAAASAERGLRLFGDSNPGGLAYCTVRLGTARLLCGEVDEAARVIGAGARLATKYRSARLTKEVRAARSRLQPWRETPAVRTLDEQLAASGLA